MSLSSEICAAIPPNRERSVGFRSMSFVSESWEETWTKVEYYRDRGFLVVLEIERIDLDFS